MKLEDFNNEQLRYVIKKLVKIKSEPRDVTQKGGGI